MHAIQKSNEFNKKKLPAGGATEVYSVLLVIYSVLGSEFSQSCQGKYI